MPIQQKCKITESVKLNNFAYSFVLEVGDMIPGTGQFLQIQCGHSRLLRRPISICDWQEGKQENLLRIVFEVRGEGTEWLSRRKTGDVLDVLGPLGHGFETDSKGSYLLVGGGIGVPPLLGCAHNAWGNCTAVLGFRDAAHAMLLDDFQQACRDVVITTDDGSLGRHGFVDAAVGELLEKGNNFTAILACGPKPMLKSIARVAAQYGVPCKVSMEERMGCGVGACLVCACDMADGSRKHVCKDGPVFDSREVDWNA